MLKVQEVNLNWISNCREHRTNNYEMCRDNSSLVLRRGQTFNMSIIFDRPFKHTTDVVRIYFKCVDVKELHPRNIASVAQNTVTRISQISRDKHVWSLQLMSAEANHIHIKMKSPCHIPFARYNLHIDTKTKTKPGIYKYQHPSHVYFLFNPWNKDDDVFMPETKLLDEYILNDVGKIYVNSSKKPKGEPWIFGQFAQPILPALILALKPPNLDFNKRGNPVHLSRELTKMLCSNDDETPRGVIEGIWNSSYDHTDCKSTDPLLWNNSVAIYEDYLKSEGKPVRFATCWILSAITTTACRAIGIPCRSVTNYNTAQDSDLSMSVDKYIIPEGMDKDMAERNDKIWEFHVWNDVWMTRYDLPPGYGGWQAIDSTPRSSDYIGDYSCGPASLEAIKRGEINHNYNTDIITSQINADVITFTYGVEENDWGERECEPVCINTDMVGKIILTKRPFIYDPNGDNDCQDITHEYKEKEGTKEERLTFFNALRKSDSMKIDAYSIDNMSFVQFKLIEIESVDLGQDIIAQVEIKSEAMSERIIHLYMGLSSLYYNGEKGKLISSQSRKITVKSNSSEIIKMRITPEEYAPKLVELGFVKLYAIGRVLDENFMWAEEDHFVINLPEVNINTVGDLEEKKEGTIEFTFRNPLKAKLTDCYFIFESPGIGRNIRLNCKDILGSEEVTIKHKVKPENPGEFPINVLFHSKQLTCVTGRSSIRVL